MPVNDQLKCIFIHIPKTGGSSINTVLRGHGGLSLFGDVPKGERRNGQPGHYHHFRWHEVKNHVDPEVWRNYFKFAVVRNPWDRVVSWFEYHKVTKSNTERKMTFDQWVRKRPGPQMYRHTHDKAGMLLTLKLDAVLRYENYAEDLSVLWERLNVRVDKMPHIKKTERRPYQEYYNDEQRQLIADHYVHDIELFGYTFDG